jgi:hypothetical protein
MPMPEQRSLTRRGFLQVGGLSSFGLSLPQLLYADEGRKAAERGARARPKSCIFLFLFGGPSHIDMWDMKPDAPAEIRGEFKPFATTVPGTWMCEHLPKMARLAKHYTIIRSLCHNKRNHQTAGSWMLTGVDPKTDNQSLIKLSPDDPPALGSLAAKLAPGSAGVPSVVMIPQVSDTGIILRGQRGGWLGSASDPLLINQDPGAADFRLEGIWPPSELSGSRLAQRRGLLQALDQGSARQADGNPSIVQFQQRAFDLLSNGKAQAAFNLAEEPAKVRDRYGRHLFGQSCLLARRLIEAGARLVTVTDMAVGGGNERWDTHAQNFPRLKKVLPPLDQAYSALLDDLVNRGLLGDTVVYLGGEFGRTPLVAKQKTSGAEPGGRDHWPDCFSGLLAGGLTRPGMIYGASDSKGAYQTRDAVPPEDLVATLFSAMGLDPQAVVHTRDGRPMPVTHGKPITALLA